MKRIYCMRDPVLIDDHDNARMHRDKVRMSDGKFTAIRKPDTKGVKSILKPLSDLIDDHTQKLAYRIQANRIFYSVNSLNFILVLTYGPAD
jgi:hypothetical protein